MCHAPQPPPALLLLLLLSPHLRAARAGAGVNQLPNLVIFLVDDLGHANVGFTRPQPTPEVQTPVMDNLAAKGMLLTRFYAFKVP